jgi:hypothetical protein
VLIRPAAVAVSGTAPDCPQYLLFMAAQIRAGATEFK